jgi:putative hydrolase of HD superfamily
MRKNSKNRDLDLLYEIGWLRFIKRSWQRFLNTDFQNLAEHHFRVAWIAIILAAGEKKVNMEKLIKMALAHDIAESRTGDADYLQRQYVIRNENLALKDILEKTSIEKEFVKLIEEYEKRDSIEAKIVKDADNLDVDLELREQEIAGRPLRREWTASRKFVATKRLYTAAAKKLWKEIQKSHPHDWHIKGRNRFTSGDWRE